MYFVFTTGVGLLSRVYLPLRRRGVWFSDFVVSSVPRFLVTTPASNDKGAAIDHKLVTLFIGGNLGIRPFGYNPSCVSAGCRRTMYNHPSVGLSAFVTSPRRIHDLCTHCSTSTSITIIRKVVKVCSKCSHSQNSSTRITQLLNVPIILIISTGSTTCSVTPLLSKFVGFHPSVHVTKIVFGHINSPRRCQVLRRIYRSLGIAYLNCLPGQGRLRRRSHRLKLSFDHSGRARKLSVLTNLLRRRIS